MERVIEIMVVLGLILVGVLIGWWLRTFTATHTAEGDRIIYGDVEGLPLTKTLHERRENEKILDMQ